MPALIYAPPLLAIPTVGISLNLLIVISLLRKQLLRKIANIFFFNQALADILFLSLLPLITTEYYLENWSFGEIACRALIILDSMNQFSSVFLLTVMSVDRYLSLSRPLSRIQYRTKKYAWILSLATWAIACLLCTPLWFLSHSYGGEEQEQDATIEKCYFLESEDAQSADHYKMFTVYAFLIGFLIPLATISAANISILRHIKRGKNTDKYQPRIHTKNASNDNDKRRRTCVIVVICTVIFALCWMPLYAFLIYGYFIAGDNSHANNSSIVSETFNNDTMSEANYSIGHLESSNSSTSEEPAMESSPQSLDNIRMLCLMLSYCNGMLNPLVLLTMSGSMRKSLRFGSSSNVRNVPNARVVQTSQKNSKIKSSVQNHNSAPHQRISLLSTTQDKL